MTRAGAPRMLVIDDVPRHLRSATRSARPAITAPTLSHSRLRGPAGLGRHGARLLVDWWLVVGAHAAMRTGVRRLDGIAAPAPGVQTAGEGSHPSKTRAAQP